MAPADAMLGSWAGAMGHGQFMPSSFLSFAVDHDRDGRRDIWSNDPTDGLASIANYLAQHDWHEIASLGGLRSCCPTGLISHRPVPNIAFPFPIGMASGVRTMEGTALPDYGDASVLCPSGAAGPAFLVNHNFHVILTYNRAEAYGIAVGHLSDRLAGSRDKITPCPEGLTPLTRSQMAELQTRLTAAGYDTQGADGFTGPNTRAALRAYQSANGQVPDGFATLDLMNGLIQSA